MYSFIVRKASLPIMATANCIAAFMATQEAAPKVKPVLDAHATG